MRYSHSSEAPAARARHPWDRTRPGRVTVQPRAILTDIAVTAIMSRCVVSVRYTDTLDDALRMFAAARLRHLAVTDRVGRAVGVLTDRVTAAAWAHNPMAFDRTTVGELLDADQPLVPRDATVAAAARVMRRCDTDAVVVVDDAQTPCGILTVGDIIAVLAKPHALR